MLKIKQKIIKQKIIKIATLSIFVIISNLFFSFAQSDTSGIDIILEPSNPKVGVVFTATLQSYAMDVDKADISWILDKKVIKSGFGEKSVNLTMGKDYKNLLVKAVTPEGKVFVSGVSLLEKSVSIIWEGADSYIPDWYKGKKYIARGGMMRAVAVANISDGANYIDNKDLVFKWEVNGEIQEKASGLGKYYTDLRVIDEYGDEVDVAVTVSPRLSSESVKESIIVSPKDPLVLFYEDSDTYGIFKRTLGDEINISAKEISLIAEPFYFSVDSLKLNNMSYTWSINNKDLTGPNVYKRTFKLGEKSGSSIVGLYIENLSKLLQDYTTQIKINF